jgi:hypothetical protein
MASGEPSVKARLGRVVPKRRPSVTARHIALVFMTR